MTPGTSLRAIKALHTLIWAFFVGCIVAIPVQGSLGHYRAAAFLTSLVLVEIVILLATGFRCPLTALAARYTDDRCDNFDICLPRWLARHNKLISGSLFLGGVLYTLGRWRGWTG